MRRTLAGRVVLVTGASRGLGADIAADLARAGVRLALTARSHGALNAVAARLKGDGAEVEPFPADLADPAARVALVAAVAARFGSLDGLVNAACSGCNVTLADSTPELVRAAAEVNFFAPVELIRLAHPQLLKSATAGRQPVVVNVVRSGGGAAVAGGRQALVGLTQAARIEFARYDIAVTWVPEQSGPASVVGALSSG